MAIKTSTQTEYQKAASFGYYHNECYETKQYDDPPTTQRTVETLDAEQSKALAVWAKCDECRGNIHQPPKYE